MYLTLPFKLLRKNLNRTLIFALVRSEWGGSVRMNQDAICRVAEVNCHRRTLFKCSIY